MKSPFMRNLIQKRFSTRIIYVLTLFIVAVSISFTGFFVYSLKESAKANLLREGELLAWMLANNSRLSVFSENEGLLNEQINSIFSDDKVVEASIYSDEGQLLRRKVRDGMKKDDLEAIQENEQKILAKRLTIHSFHLVEQSSFFSFWAPVLTTSIFPAVENALPMDSPLPTGSSIIGYISLSLSTTEYQRTIDLLLLKGALLALIFSLSGSVAVYLLAKRITRPLMRLTESVNMLGQGGEVEKIKIETKDEIGVLAHSFNNMTDSLKFREKEKAVLEAQLRQAQKMEAIGTLSGGIAHDFNNLLFIIMGYSKMLEDNVGKKGKAYLEQINKAANRAANLTKGLLAFSRKQVINPKPMNLNENIRNLKKLLIRLINEDIEMKVELAPDELIVMADTGQMDQVVMNLVTNARDAMPNGGTLTIKTQTTSPDDAFLQVNNLARKGRYACLSVGDSGTGIAEEISGKIFDPFFTTKDVGKGTGLGLSIVIGIVNQHGGAIVVHSRPGEGANFMIYLPLIELIAEPETIDVEVIAFGGGETVLLAEDDAQVRCLTREILEQYGYKVIEAINGEDAIMKFRQHSDAVKVLITDVIMPKKNGKEVYEAIIALNPAVHAVFISGYEDEIISNKGILRDNISFLAKPFKPTDIVRKIQAILNPKEGRERHGSLVDEPAIGCHRWGKSGSLRLNLSGRPGAWGDWRWRLIKK